MLGRQIEKQHVQSGKYWIPGTNSRGRFLIRPNVNGEFVGMRCKHATIRDTYLIACADVIRIFFGKGNAIGKQLHLVRKIRCAWIWRVCCADENRGFGWWFKINTNGSLLGLKSFSKLLIETRFWNIYFFRTVFYISLQLETLWWWIQLAIIHRFDKVTSFAKCKGCYFIAFWLNYVSFCDRIALAEFQSLNNLKNCSETGGNVCTEWNVE